MSENVREDMKNTAIRALDDDARFPRRWQASAALVTLPVVASIIGLLYILIIAVFPAKSAFGNEMLSYITSQLPCMLLIPFLTLYFARSDIRSTVRLRRGIDIQQVLLLLVVSFGAFLLCQYTNAVFVNIMNIISGVQHTIPSSVNPQNVPQQIFQFVIISGLPMFCEEFFFRGVIFRSFERAGVVVAVMVSALTFAAMHGNFFQFFYALQLGVILAVLVYISNSLLSGMLVHGTLNALSVIVSYPAVSGWLNKNVFISETVSLIIYLVIGSLLLAIGLLGFIAYSRSKSEKRCGIAIENELDRRILPKPAKWEGVVTAIGIAAMLVFYFANMIITWFIL